MGLGRVVTANLLCLLVKLESVKRNFKSFKIKENENCASCICFGFKISKNKLNLLGANHCSGMTKVDKYRIYVIKKITTGEKYIWQIK